MWYTSALEKNGVAWSAPYMDAFGLGVVMSASKALRDSEGKFYGVCSMDMTFGYITELMKTVTSKNSSVVCRYLIDAEGNVILSTKIKEEQGRGLEARIAQPLTPSIPLAVAEEPDATAAEAAEIPAAAASTAEPIDAGAQVAVGGEA